jgi:phosphoribosylamine--glycine ligase
MQILVIDPSGLALDFCVRSIAEGHNVRWFIRDTGRDEPSIGRGLVPHVSDWRANMRWADLVYLPDNAVYMRDLEWYRRQGFPIFGASSESAKWELDRGTGMAAFEAHGIATLPGEVFTGYNAAIAHVTRTMRRYVSKPSGDADRALSYVSKGPEDMVYMLERWKASAALKSSFILQEFVGGYEMAVGAWVGRSGFISPWCENWEYKKLMAGDTGPNTGEQGTIVRYVEHSKLAEKVLAPLESALVAAGHLGYIDVNCIIDKQGNPWPLEFTSRPGWPIFNIQQRLHTNTADWMKEALSGAVTDGTFVTDTVASGVVVSIPDYPYNKLPRAEVSGIPIYGYNDHRENIHLCEVKAGVAPIAINDKLTKGAMLVSAGTYLLVTTGTAEIVSEATEEAVNTAKSLIIPNSPMWRNDIGAQLQQQIPKLNRLGYAKNLRY